jgi:hypothetical protein
MVVDSLSGRAGAGGIALLYGRSGEDKAGRGMDGCQGGVYPWW